MQFSYIIIDNLGSSEKISLSLKEFDHFLCVAVCNNYDNGINKILQLKPNIVFLSLNDELPSTIKDSFSIISELSEYLDELPTIIVFSPKQDYAYEAYKRGVYGFILTPIDISELRKCLLRFTKNHQNKLTDKICIKSHGDYHFIKTNEIIYLKADNNTTDFYLSNGKVVIAYKTLKYFENLLPFYFFRIHHSYVVNINFVSRINLGKSKCFLFDNEIVLSFSRTYKDNIDAIILKIS